MPIANIRPETFYELCSDEEKEELKYLINSKTKLNDEKTIALEYFRGNFDLKKFVREIGVEKVKEILERK